MTQLYSLDRFANVIIVDALARRVFPEESKEAVYPRYISILRSTVNYLKAAFYKNLHEVYMNRSFNFHHSEKCFVKYALSKCMVLSKHYGYFNMLLCCAFLSELLVFIYDKNGCFYFTSAAIRCMRIVLKGRFHVFFSDYYEWNNLIEFCERVNSRVASTNTGYLSDVLTNSRHVRFYAAVLIGACNNSEEYVAIAEFEDTVWDGELILTFPNYTTLNYHVYFEAESPEKSVKRCRLMFSFHTDIKLRGRASPVMEIQLHWKKLLRKRSNDALDLIELSEKLLTFFGPNGSSRICEPCNEENHQDMENLLRKYMYGKNGRMSLRQRCINLFCDFILRKFL